MPNLKTMKYNNFINQLNKIQDQYEEEQRRNDQFNIFRALHKDHNEKFLHSRFISYLLSPASKHKMGDKFLRAFMETISSEHTELKNFTIQGCEVRPNEEDKREYKEIDILIKNDRQQAIVIENKIYAKDSNHPGKDNEDEVQLNKYCDRIKSEAGEIFAVYLTLDGHDPERVDEIRYKPLYKIDYHKEIKNWIDRCVEIADNQLLKDIIQQYRTVVLSLTSNLDRVGDFRRLISNDFGLAWENREKIIGMEDFKHVKWHTVADFWNELSSALEEFGAEVPQERSITKKELTKVTHSKDGKSYGINVIMPSGKEWYIVNDARNGLTYGTPMSETKKEGQDWFTINGNIKFSEFDNKETFELISPEKRKELINRVVGFLKE